LAIDESLNKGTSLVAAPHEEKAILNLGYTALAKALIEQVALEDRHIPLEGRTTPWIIAKFEINLSLSMRGYNLESDIPDCRGDVMSALAIGQSAVIVTPEIQDASYIATDASQSVGIVKRLGEPFGFMQGSEVLLKSLEGHQYTAELEAQINRLLLIVAGVREVAERIQSLFQAVERLPVGRLLLSSERGLTKGHQRLIPDFTVKP